MKARAAITIGLAILGLATVFLITGRSAGATKPSVQDYGASGTSAWAELVRRDGYQVRLDRTRQPKLNPEALMVVPMVPIQEGWEEYMEGLTEEAEEIEEDSKAESEDEAEGNAESGSEATASPPRRGREFWREAILTHLRQGGHVLVVHHDGEGVRDVGYPTNVKLWDGTAMKITVSTGSDGIFPLVLPNVSEMSRAHAVEGDRDVAREAFPAKGRIIILKEGHVLENRSLDKHDNAVFALGWVRELQKSGGEVVFYEGALDNVESKGLIESIGPWANTARWQFILLLAVVAYASGMMFGRPILDRIPQRSSQHLMEAFGSALSRGDHNRFVMQRELIQAKQRLERTLGMAPDSDWNQIFPHLTPSLAEHIKLMQANAAFPGRKIAVILGYIATLESEIQGFESQVRSGRDAEFLR